MDKIEDMMRGPTGQGILELKQIQQICAEVLEEAAKHVADNAKAVDSIYEGRKSCMAVALELIDKANEIRASIKISDKPTVGRITQLTEKEDKALNNALLDSVKIVANPAEMQREIQSLQAENERLRGVLTELCRLKDEKDQLGKTQEYLTRQPRAWKKAFELVGHIELTERG